MENWRPQDFSFPISHPATLQSTLRRGLPWLLGLIVAGFFAFNAVRYIDEGQRELRLLPWLAYDNRVDFAYFYAGAEMAAHGDAADLYPVQGELTFYPGDAIFRRLTDDYEKARVLARGNYYNPPALAYLQAPLTLLGFRVAFWLFTAGSLAALGGTLYLTYRFGTGVVELPFLLLGIIAFRPVYEAIIMGHVALFFVLVLTAGFFALRSGRTALTGLLFSLLVLKPQWAVLPGLFLLVRGEWRALTVMAVVGAAIFFLPFLATGPSTFKNYVLFLRDASQIDLRDAPHMFSWNGFLFKLHGGAFTSTTTPICGGPCWLYNAVEAIVPPLSKGLVYGLVAVTTVPLLAVWRSRDFHLGVAATVIAMLLVSTHSVWYDWALLVVAAIFLVLRPWPRRGMRIEMWGVLLALLLCAGQSIAVVLSPDRHFIDWHRPGLFLVTPVAFVGLLWLVSVAWREGLLRLPLRRSRSALQLPAGS